MDLLTGPRWLRVLPAFIRKVSHFVHLRGMTSLSLGVPNCPTFPVYGATPAPNDSSATLGLVETMMVEVLLFDAKPGGVSLRPRVTRSSRMEDSKSSSPMAL